MRKYILIGMVILFASTLAPVRLLAQTGEDLMQEAKLLMFDKKWKEALSKVERILDEYPESAWYSQAVFYKAKCLDKQEDREAAAVRAYKEYLKSGEINPSLREESELSIIELGYRLYQRGQDSFVRDIIERLESRNTRIRYFAALQLSFIKEKRTAKKGVSVLEEILENEKDEELKDRARLALVRIDPQALDDYKDSRDEPKEKLIHVQVINSKDGKVTFSLSIPWALADLAFSAIPNKERAMIKKEGYDLNKIIDRLTRIKGSVMEFQEGDVKVKIWIK